MARRTTTDVNNNTNNNRKEESPSDAEILAQIAAIRAENEALKRDLQTRVAVKRKAKKTPKRGENDTTTNQSSTTSTTTTNNNNNNNTNKEGEKTPRSVCRGATRRVRGRRFRVHGEERGERKPRERVTRQPPPRTCQKKKPSSRRKQVLR